MLTKNPFLPFCTSIILLSAPAITAQESFRYREFQLGSDLATVAKLAATTPAAARVVHARPSAIKELEWRPRYSSGSAATETDPVDLVVFKFYDDQLYAVVVDYDRRRTAGLTVPDMIDAISAIYGPVTALPSRQIGLPAEPYSIPDTPVALWGGSEYTVSLLRVAYPESFRMVITSVGLENLARRARAASVRQDADEAPQREIARQQKAADASVAAQEKARRENRAVFKP
jgi:hypothetical protein